MQARAAQALVYNARCARTSHLVSGDKTARRVLSLVILTCISFTNTPLLVKHLKLTAYSLVLQSERIPFFLDFLAGPWSLD